MVVWVNLTGVKSEQIGYRPCVVIQNNIGNQYSPNTIIAPLTSKSKNSIPTHVKIPGEYAGGLDSLFLGEQIRVIDKSRITNIECMLPKKLVDQIDVALDIACDFGDNINFVYVQLDGVGSEHKGDKPCPAISIQNSMGDYYSTTTIIAPLSRNIPRYPTQVEISKEEFGDSIELNTVLFEQVRVIDRDRIKGVVKPLMLNEITKSKLKAAFRLSVGLPPTYEK